MSDLRDFVRIVFAVLATVFVAANVGAAERDARPPEYPRERAGGYYGDRSALRSATVETAKRILARQGGMVLEPYQAEGVFRARVQLPSRLPFTEQALDECGRCILFPTVPAIGPRAASADILSMMRAPEIKARIFFTESPRTAWFLNESFARQAPAMAWHLVRLTATPVGVTWQEAKGHIYPDREKMPSTVTAIQMLALVPDAIPAGSAFFTGDDAHRGNSVVVVGREGGSSVSIRSIAKIVRDPSVGVLVERRPDARF